MRSLDSSSPNSSSSHPSKPRRLPLLALIPMIFSLQGDMARHVQEWKRSCEQRHEDAPGNGHHALPFTRFEAQPLQAKKMVQWPEGVDNPLRHIRPTFDDGPHVNDLSLIPVLSEYGFDTSIFYYNGVNFFTEEAMREITASPGCWRQWFKGNFSALLLKLDPEKLAIARAIYEAGFTIGFHGMEHAQPEHHEHLQHLSREQFLDDLKIFEQIIAIATGNEHYAVTHVRPPYGGGTNDILSPDFVDVCEEKGIDIRNWSFSSFDWETSDTRGEKLLAEALRVVERGQSPDILFHSQHQDGTTRGNFGKFLAMWSGHILSLRVPERAEERATYATILNGILSNTVEGIHVTLPPSPFPLGSGGQIAVDSAYNTGLEAQYMGALQTRLGLPADGYVEGSTVSDIQKRAPEETVHMQRREIARVLKDPVSLRESSLGHVVTNTTYPEASSLMKSGVTFANRGLQVQSIASDILCQLSQGGFDANFLEAYRFKNLYIDPDRIPTYVAMYDFLKNTGLDDQTTARILATALLETGVKNDLDSIGIGKGTVEVAGRAMHASLDYIGATETIPSLVRKAGFAKQAGVMRYGLGSIGHAQAPLALTHAMCEAILERKVTDEEMQVILFSPQGAALAVYLHMRQHEVRLQSQIW